ncbi:hypothetical protein AcV5_009851 [Taiwanofungus camphoratus]|nr:hypothetical protein AcV5_009851 [Antrodia cinnamomea]
MLECKIPIFSPTDQFTPSCKADHSQRLTKRWEEDKVIPNESYDIVGAPYLVRIEVPTPLLRTDPPSSLSMRSQIVPLSPPAAGFPGTSSFTHSRRPLPPSPATAVVLIATLVTSLTRGFIVIFTVTPVIIYINVLTTTVVCTTFVTNSDSIRPTNNAPPSTGLPHRDL